MRSYTTSLSIITYHLYRSKTKAIPKNIVPVKFTIRIIFVVFKNEVLSTWMKKKNIITQASIAKG